MDLLLKDVWIPLPGYERFERGDLLIRGGVISKVGEVDLSSLGGDVWKIYGRGKLAVIPGLVNAHSHVAMSLLRGVSEELPLKRWLEERIWPLEAKLEAEDVYWGSLLSIAEMISGGVTCFADMYFYMDQVALAAKESGVRANLSRGLIEGFMDTRLEEGLRLIRAWDGHDGRIRVFLGPHAPYTCSPEFLRRIAEIALEEGVGVHVHWLETAWERDYIEGSLGKDPILLLGELGLDRAKRLLLAHGVFLPRERLSEMARENVFVVHNPSSNMKLGSGFAPVPEMIEAGVNVALGTDGPASNDRQDLFWEMRLCALVHKGAKGDPTAVKAKDVLKMATEVGSRALGFEGIGRIEEGFEADLVLVDLDRPNYVGFDEENLSSMLVYAGSSSDVLATFVRGVPLYYRGEFKTIDLERVKFEVLRSRRRLLG